MNKKSKGFTLIELIVVMAIFLFIIGAAMGIFIAIIQQQKNILSEMELLNEASYIQELMSKAIRMAAKDTSGNCITSNYSYMLTNSDGTNYQGIQFLNQSETDSNGAPVCEEFYLDSGGVLEEIKGTGQESITSQDLLSPVALSDLSKFKINYIRFGIDGNNGNSQGGPAGDQDTGLTTFQPRVTVLMSMSIVGNSDVPAITIQTTVSQRNINVPISQ